MRIYQDDALRLETSHIKAPSGCWIWVAGRDRDGYGRIQYQGASCMAHRVILIVTAGAELDGLEVDHLCRVRRCVNPAHLDVVTKRVNSLRSLSPAALNARKESCKHGHPFDEANTRITRHGRACRACVRAANKRAYDKAHGKATHPAPVPHPAAADPSEGGGGRG